MSFRPPRILLLLVTAVCAVVLPLALLEAILRLAGFGYPSHFFVPIPGAAAYTTNQKFGRRFFPVQLARTPVPERVAAVKPPGTFRIFILGESAAMGFPDPGFSFGRHLEVMLRRMYPDRRFEVIQASMTAINSHVILPIARNCAALQPDLFIVYAGNNEVVGPFGAGTVFHSFTRSLSLIRASVWLNGTRTGQWLSQLRPRRDQPAEWRGMEMFLGHSMAADDPRLQTVYANFRRNLADICRIARGAGAPAIVSTVAVNLKDSPPFASGPQGLADLRFRRAQSLLAVGKVEEARSEFARARDLDTLRFRADSHINRIIREVASTAGGRLVDAERLFARDGIPGDNLFYEHVHLNFAGNYLLARALLPEVTAALRLPSASTPAEDTVAHDLARTAWDDYRAQADITAMMQRPPFAKRGPQVRPPDPDSMDAAKTQYLEALNARPDDLHIRQRLADLLAVRGELPAAEMQWRTLLDRIPNVESWRIALASVLANEHKLDEALDQYQQVLRADPQSAAAQFGAGSVLQRQRRWDDAARFYAAALRLNPNYAEVENNLGLMRMESSADAPGAIEHYRRALAMNPDLPATHMNLAGALAQSGRTQEAAAVYEQFLQAHPDEFEAHYNLAGLRARAGKLQPAREHLEAAARLRPSSAEAHYDLGSILSRQGALPEAITEFTKALSLRPDYAEAWNNLGSAQARSGNLTQATACFKKALALRPNFPAARSNLAAAMGR